MRLLLVSSEFPPGPGGIATHAHQIALNLARSGWQVAVLSPQHYASPAEIRKFNQNQPLQIISLNGLKFKALGRLQTVRHWLRTWQPQVLLASGGRAVWLASWARLGRRLPLISVGHGKEFGVTIAWERFLTRRAFARAHTVVCVSHYTQKRMQEMGINPPRQKVIPNGADPDTFRPLPGGRVIEFRRRLGLPFATLLLTVGNVTERKGQDIVIHTLPALLKTFPEIHYLMVGLPTEREALYSLARTLGVAERVHFLGVAPLPTLVEAYNACDIHVMTSRHSRDGDFEGYGIAAVEAALCGKPSVVSSGCGLEEAVVPNQTGLVAPREDVPATAAALTQLLGNRPELQRLGTNARTYALANQTWSRRAAAYEEVLQAALN